MLGTIPVDIQVTDTYFVVAHIHYVFFGGSVLTIFAGVHYWFPKMTGKMYNERLGSAGASGSSSSASTRRSCRCTGSGLQGMPRRVAVLRLPLRER